MITANQQAQAYKDLEQTYRDTFTAQARLAQRQPCPSCGHCPSCGSYRPTMGQTVDTFGFKYVDPADIQANQNR